MGESESTRTADDPFTFEAVPAVGTVLSGIAMVGVLLPFRRGVTDPAITAAVVLALVAVAAFVARRHGRLNRRISGGLAAVSSFGVVLLSGYALNQGITGNVSLPIGTETVPFVFGAFLAACGAIGLAVADSQGIDSQGVLWRTKLTVALTLVGVVGLLTAYLAMLVLAVPAYLVLGEFSDVDEVIIAQLGMAIGTAIVAVGYLRFVDRPLSFLDLRVPSLRDVGWTVGGVVLLFGALIAISTVMSSTGVEGTDHSSVEIAEENPELMLLLVPAAILVIGPFEELLYRNVIQKRLYDRFSRVGAIVVGSVVFAAVHMIAYDTGGEIGAIMASLGVVFGLSLVLGFIYERTDNLVVPALVHGIYDAIVFLNLYYTYA